MGRDRMKYWIVIMTPKNFSITKEKLGFKFVGLPQRYKRKASQIKVGDNIVYYLTKLSVFGAIVRVDGGLFNDTKDLWVSENDIYPVRIPTKLEYNPHNTMLNIKEMIEKVDFIQIKNMWGAYLRTSIREISEKDFQTIKTALENLN